MLSIQTVQQEGKQLDTVKELFVAYSLELGEDLCFQSFEEELKNPLKKYVDTGGCIFLAYFNNEPAGCIALLPLQETGLCEMKRLFVLPQYRKQHIGEELVTTILKFAAEEGFTKMVLDTLQRLQPAIKLYQQFGFTTTAAYYNNPISEVVYMEKQIQ